MQCDGHFPLVARRREDCHRERPHQGDDEQHPPQVVVRCAAVQYEGHAGRSPGDDRDVDGPDRQGLSRAAGQHQRRRADADGEPRGPAYGKDARVAHGLIVRASPRWDKEENPHPAPDRHPGLTVAVGYRPALVTPILKRG